jgi:hypothetical protein
MDRATIDRHEQLAVPGTGHEAELPIHLNDPESLGIIHCRDNNLRLEQERLPQIDVLTEMAKLRNISHRNR